MKHTNFPDATKRNRLKLGKPNNAFWLVVWMIVGGVFGCIAMAALYAMINHYLGHIFALVSLVIMIIGCILCLFWIALSVVTGTAEKDFKQFE